MMVDPKRRKRVFAELRKTLFSKYKILLLIIIKIVFNLLHSNRLTLFNKVFLYLKKLEFSAIPQKNSAFRLLMTASDEQRFMNWKTSNYIISMHITALR